MIKGNIQVKDNSDRIKVEPITEFITEPLDKNPQLIQDFISLEGEGGTIGRSALYLRLGVCNARCTFCFGSPTKGEMPYITMSNERAKKLNEVKVGDKLLTYNNDQELVETEVYDTSSRIVHEYLNIKIEGKNYHVTEEHPFFTTGGLKQACELEIGDLIIHTNMSELASFRMKGDKNHMKDPVVAKKSSMNTDYNIHREYMLKNNNMNNPETRKKLSDSLKASSYDFSEKMKGDKNPMKDPKILEKNIKAHNFGKSKQEEYFHQICSENDIILNFVGNNKLIINNKVPDFIIPDTNKIIELFDSTFLYGDSYRDENWVSDRKQFFEKEGYECLIIDMNTYRKKKHKEELLTIIRKFYHNGYRVESIKKENDKELEVFNLSCYPYNTYLINNMWVHNCDTSFSIEGKSKYNIVDTNTKEMVDYLSNKYPYKKRITITNLSITGGEPLLSMKHFNSTMTCILAAFPNISNVIFETNGTLISVKENCYTLIDQLGPFSDKINFMLSISPKLDSKVSYSKVLTDNEILKMYKSALRNYSNLLDAHFSLQVKFVHDEDLEPQNQKLIDFILDPTTLDKNIDNNCILIMPFTPDDPLGKRADIWRKSKDAAARFALDHNFRYSPRIHIDRQLD